MLKPVFLLVILIFLNAVFASAEIAVISISEAKLKKLSSDGNRKAKKLLRLVEQPARFLATIQVAITLASLLQSAFAADSFADPLVNWLISIGVDIPYSVLNTLAVIVITLILAYFNLILGELVPKRIAMKKAEAMALGMSGMLYGISKVFAPIVWLLTVSTNLCLKMLGINPDEQDEQVTEEEIKLMLTEGSEQGNIQTEETEIIQNVFEFNDISVDEICTHRREVSLLKVEDGDDEWHNTICESRHTYYPICGEKIDEIIAVLDARAYFRLGKASRETIMKEATEQPYFIPESMKANVLFKEMKNSRRYFAVVIDEYGGLSGIITLHDLIETLVGDINEQEDQDVEEDIKQMDQNTWQILGNASIREVSDVLGIDLVTDEFDTFGGFITREIGRIPEDDETFSFETDQLTIEILDVKSRAFGKTIVTKKPSLEPDDK